MKIFFQRTKEIHRYNCYTWYQKSGPDMLSSKDISPILIEELITKYLKERFPSLKTIRYPNSFYFNFGDQEDDDAFQFHLNTIIEI